MAYPATKTTFTDPNGTSLLTSPDHASLHTSVNDTIEAIEDTVGTTAGTNVLKNFAAGDFAARINASNVPQQLLSGGTINNSIIGTPTVTGGTITSLIGTSQITGGTITSLIGTSQITGGTASSITLGTPIMNHFTSSGTTAPSQADVALAPTVATIADAAGGTIALNAAAAQVFNITLGTTAGNRTFGTPANPTNGQALLMAIKASGSANGTLVFPSIYRMSDSGTPTIGTASTWNYYGWRFNSTDTKWDFQGASTNII